MAWGALSAISVSTTSRAVIGAGARRSTSTALRNSVPRLNHGLLLLRRFAAMPQTLIREAAQRNHLTRIIPTKCEPLHICSSPRMTSYVAVVGSNPVLAAAMGVISGRTFPLSQVHTDRGVRCAHH
jgi:hypothetical protein